MTPLFPSFSRSNQLASAFTFFLHPLIQFIAIGRDWLYDHGIRAGKIDTVISSLVRKVSNDLISEISHGGCVDEYLRDQLVVYQALAKGMSSVNGGKRSGELVDPSLHAQTAQWVVEKLLGVEFDKEGGCEGVSFVPGIGVEPKSNAGNAEGLVERLESLEV